MTEPPGARLRVGLTGLTVAEYFRDQEHLDVLLFIDNIFRFVQAGSEVSGFRAGKVGRDTVLAQIIRLVEDAQGSKAPVQRLADKISSVFVPIVVVLAALTFAGWYLFGGGD